MTAERAPRGTQGCNRSYTGLCERSARIQLAGTDSDHALVSSRVFACT